MRAVILALILAWPTHLSVRSYAPYVWDRSLPCKWKPTGRFLARPLCFRATWGVACSPGMDREILSCLRSLPEVMT